MKSSELSVGMAVAVREYKWGEVWKGRVEALGKAYSKHERPYHTVSYESADGSSNTRKVKPHQIVSEWTTDLEAAAEQRKVAHEEQQMRASVQQKLDKELHAHAEEVAHLANLLGLDALVQRQYRNFTNSAGESVGANLPVVVIGRVKRLEELLRPVIANKLLGGQNQ